MIEPLAQTAVNSFNRHTLTVLKPYFDIGPDSGQKDLWYRNLLVLAQHNLGVAHCLFHHWGARIHLMNPRVGTDNRDFRLGQFDEQMGCVSNAKSTDDSRLEMINDTATVTGNKHWVSNLAQADFGVFSVSHLDHEAVVLYDFTDNLHNIKMHNTPIGMEIAAAGSVIDNHYKVPAGYILGYRYVNTNNKFSSISNLIDYAFITNYLGVITALFKDLKQWATERNIDIKSQLRSLELDIATLKLLWDCNLDTVYATTLTDHFWHKRNTQYTQSKKTLLSLIELALRAGDPRWLDRDSTGAGQRFRDALVFSSHMQTLYHNLHARTFITF